MKKRLRKTGEIVDVVSFNNFYQSERDDSDQVSYIDSKGVEHHHVRGLNLWWDFEDIPIEDTRIPNFDWEQRRYEIAKEALLKETNIARDEQEMAVIDNILFRCWQMGWLDKYDDTKHSNSEKIGKNLKEFDLEAAKSGKPVCTRDGRKARIICFDRICGDDYYKIVACVTAFDGDFEEVLSYGIDGYIVDSQNPKDEDLMMLSEKKEGWVNVYQGGKLDTKSYPTKKEAFDKASPKGYVDTIKINWSE